MYRWSRDYTHKDFAHESRIDDTASHTTVDRCSFFREGCEGYLIDYPVVIRHTSMNYRISRVTNRSTAP
jgi:hypothetical protein